MFQKGQGGFTGRSHSPETRRKIANTLKGRNRPPEVIERIRSTQLAMGENHPNRKHGLATTENLRTYKTFMEKRRRLRKKTNGGSHTLGEWETLKAQYNWTCPGCDESEPEIILTEDHIIPISRGGSDNIENIQPLCLECNQRKGTKIYKFETMD